MIQVNIHELKTNASRYLEQVEQGEVVLVCRRNVPIAEIRAVNGQVRKGRSIGLHDGWFTVPDEVFAPMSDEEVEEWERPIF
ncbi:MAG: type II toxin-antitoxin system prevent-host-death family antitoxin [Fimbriimonadales bacterium]